MRPKQCYIKMKAIKKQNTCHKETHRWWITWMTLSHNQKGLLLSLTKVEKHNKSLSVKVNPPFLVMGMPYLYIILQLFISSKRIVKRQWRLNFSSLLEECYSLSTSSPKGNTFHSMKQTNANPDHWYSSHPCTNYLLYCFSSSLTTMRTWTWLYFLWSGELCVT